MLLTSFTRAGSSEVDRDLLTLEVARGCGQAVAEVGGEHLAAQSVVGKHILKLGLPGGVEELGDEGAVQLLKGRVGRGEDSKGSVFLEDVTEASGVDGGNCGYCMREGRNTTDV